MASEQVGPRKKQSRSGPREELRHPVLYRHQDCIPNPKLIQNCGQNSLLGLKNNTNNDVLGKVNTEQGTNDSKNNAKKLNLGKNKHDERTEKVVQESKTSSLQSNGTIGNSEELSKSRKRRLRKRRLLVALAPVISNNKPTPPPPVENKQTIKPISRPVAQSIPAVPINPVTAQNRTSESGKPSVKESRKRSEKSINSRSKSLKSKSLAETTHQTKADIIKTLEEKTLNSLLQTLVPLTNSSPKKERPSVPFFSFPEKKFNSSESKVDKDGVFYFGETKHQLEKLSSSFSNYSTSPFSNKSDAQTNELKRNCYSASKVNSLENCVPSFNFSQTATDRTHFSPNIRQNLFDTEAIPFGSRVESSNNCSVPSNYPTKDFVFNSSVLKDLNQFRAGLQNFSSLPLTPAASSAVFSNRPSKISEISSETNSLDTSPQKIVEFTQPLVEYPQQTVGVSQHIVQFPENSVRIDKATLEKEPTSSESTISERVKNTPLNMKPTAEIDKSNKTREEILLEREAKKAAKLAAKAKKSAQVKKDTPSNNTSKTENSSASQNDVNLENKDTSSAVVKLPEKEADIKNENPINDPVVTLKTEVKNNVKSQELQKDASTNNTNAKSKAELRAERRAKQEAQRAAKTASKIVPSQPKEKVPQVKTDRSKPVMSSACQIEKKVESTKSLAQPKPKLFSHLYREKPSLSADKLLTVSGLHPAVVKLGVQYATRVVVGSNARCVALLHALKQMVNDYTTPSEKDFSRGLEEELGPVTAYLDRCRPLAVSMTNALRHIKRTLTQVPNSIPDAEAKRKICDVVDTYIHEQIDMAGKAICNTVRSKIANGDVILIYGCSSLLYQILVESHLSGTKFRVVVVDGLPWLEGREMLRRLVEKGLSCTYVLITAASFIMREATKVLLGAHALLANGYVMSRAGSSQVALLAHCCNVPVLVCCETHKFCERVQTDAFVYNELGELCCDSIKDKEKGRTLTNLTPLTLAYDITPPDLVSAVVTELAVLPCTSVPVILRIKPSESVM